MPNFGTPTTMPSGRKVTEGETVLFFLDTAGDIVGVHRHVGLDRGLDVGVLVLVHLQVVLVQPDLVCAGCRVWYTVLVGEAP
jgi:hypothetical protein